MIKKRAWQRMLSGRKLDLFNPLPKDIAVEDIAHGLARVSRWNGQTNGRHAFSVAQHSVLVEKIFCKLKPNHTKNECIYALFHDGAEYVIGDIISPFKAAMGGSYKKVEIKLQKAIFKKLGLPPNINSELQKKIKQADSIAAYFEAIQLAGFSKVEANKLFSKPKNLNESDFQIKPLNANMAQKQFLKRLENILKK